MDIKYLTLREFQHKNISEGIKDPLGAKNKKSALVKAFARAFFKTLEREYPYGRCLREKQGMALQDHTYLET